MKILYIDHYAGSPKLGMEFRPYYFASEWQKMGHEIRIIGATYSHLRRENPKVDKSFEIQNIEGVEFQWVKTGRYQGNGIARAKTMLQFCFKLWFKSKTIAKEFKPDIVISSSTYPFDAYPAKRIAKKAKGRYVHEAHDLWPLTLIEIGGMNKRHPFVVALGIAEKYAYKKCDKIVSILPNTLSHMLAHGLQREEKFIHVPNGIVIENEQLGVAIPEEHIGLFTKLKRQNTFIVCYMGGHALSNALDTLLDAAAFTLEFSEIAYVLIGDGILKPELQKKAKEEKLKNVYFLPPVTKNVVHSLLKMADVLYIGAASCQLYRYGVSLNKLYDYLLAAKPIIYGVEASNNEVEEAAAGITIPSGRAEEIVKAINIFRSMTSEQLDRIGMNGKNWVIKNRDYHQLAKYAIERW